MRPSDLQRIVSKVRELQREIRREDPNVEFTVDLLNQREDQNFGGRYFPASQVMATYPGKRLHLRASVQIQSDEEVKQAREKLKRNLAKQGVTNIDNINPLIALCGAGKPSKSYPFGSGFGLESERVEYTAEQQQSSFLPVTCYKCLKLHYMNTMKADGREIPTREFKPSDQKPLYTSYGPKRTVEYLQNYAPTDITFVRQKGNIFIVFINEVDSQDKRVRFHFEVDQDEINFYVQQFLDVEIMVSSEAATDPESYERRNTHVMMPMGRFGAFGSNDTNAAIKLTELYAPNDEFDISEFSTDWVEGYFKSSNNPWRANEIVLDRRTQQIEDAPYKSQTRNFESSSIDIEDYPPYLQAVNNRQDDVQFILEGFSELLQILRNISISDFYDIDPRITRSKKVSQALKGIFDAVRQERNEEYIQEQNSRSRKQILRAQRREIRKWKENYIAQKVDEGKSKIQAGRLAGSMVRMILDINNNVFDPELATQARLEEYLEIQAEERALRSGTLTSENIPMRTNNPNIDRVLPLLERVEELDTLFLELEQEYAETQGRRLRR